MKLGKGGVTEMAKGKEEESVGVATENRETGETKAKANEEKSRQPREGTKDFPQEKMSIERSRNAARSTGLKKMPIS